MGEKAVFQPLTREDRISVVLYRLGIALSAVTLLLTAYIALRPSQSGIGNATALGLLIALYVSAGLSVFCIHLYVSRFHKFLKRLYYVSVAALILLLALGKGDVSAVLLERPYGPLFLIPLSGCIGFVTAKEAFCFRLVEGYLLALFMPLYLLALASGLLTQRSAAFGIVLIALLYLVFTFRKVFMPIHYDIGDKSAYI